MPNVEKNMPLGDMIEDEIKKEIERQEKERAAFLALKLLQKQQEKPSGSIVAMIPARSGSKGIPNKNMRQTAGKPLMQYTIEAALNSRCFSNVWLNSDSEEYLNWARRFPGVDCYRRSNELAQDVTSMREVVLDFAGTPIMPYDAICVLYPTYPCRTAKDIQEFVQFFRQDSGQCLIGNRWGNASEHPFLWMDDAGAFVVPHLPQYYRRQDYPKWRVLSHFVCIVPRQELCCINQQMMNFARQRYYNIPDEANILDINTEKDWQEATRCLQRPLADSLYLLV